MEDTLKTFFILFYSYTYVLFSHIRFTASLVSIACDYNNAIIMDGEQVHDVFTYSAVYLSPRH